MQIIKEFGNVIAKDIKIAKKKSLLKQEAYQRG